MDVTNQIVKICRRITDIEYSLDCSDCGEHEQEGMRHELYTLELELEQLQPAT